MAGALDPTQPDPAPDHGRPAAEESFPRRSARTARFTAGAPRAFRPSAASRLVAFLRSSGPTDRATALWILDLTSGEERLVADPAAVLVGDERLTPEERSRRERMREGGAGITAYSTDRDGRLATFALSSKKPRKPWIPTKPSPGNTMRSRSAIIRRW